MNLRGRLNRVERESTEQLQSRLDAAIAALTHWAMTYLTKAQRLAALGGDATVFDGAPPGAMQEFNAASTRLLAMGAITMNALYERLMYPCIRDFDEDDAQQMADGFGWGIDVRASMNALADGKLPPECWIGKDGSLVSHDDMNARAEKARHATPN